MNFPLVTWQVDAPQFTTTAGIEGGVPAWGYGYSGTTTPPLDTLAGIIWTALDNAGATFITVGYSVANTTGPSLSPAAISWEYDSASPITFTFASLADAAVYGFSSTTVTFPASTIPQPTQFAAAPYNAACHLAPSGVSCDVTRTTKQRAAASSSDMSGLTTDVVNWGQVADVEVKSTLFPAANTFRWYATQSIYAQKAQRSVNDPNNILEKMLEAAATGVTFRVYEGDATAAGFTNQDYLVCRMPAVVAKSSAMDVVQADEPGEIARIVQLQIGSPVVVPTEIHIVLVANQTQVIIARRSGLNKLVVLAFDQFLTQVLREHIITVSTKRMARTKVVFP